MLIVLSSGLEAITGVLGGPRLLALIPTEPVWLRPVLAVAVLLGLLLAAAGFMLWFRR